uniref:BTB domain-containing protein n=1 Tax=Panagrolaimus superbus TaxID=310955 RepID=A0A914ZAC2_9BILA
MSVSENVENVAEKFDNEDQSHHPETESESESSNDEEEEESSDDLDSGEEESEYEFAKVASKEVLQLFEMLSNDRFTDVNLVISDTVEIKSHRCVLGHFSKIFANIFENSNETPVRIYVKDFKMETLKAALEFLYGNSNAIKGKEKDVLKFANKYEILQLKVSFFYP